MERSIRITEKSDYVLIERTGRIDRLQISRCSTEDSVRVYTVFGIVVGDELLNRLKGKLREFDLFVSLFATASKL